ncbi:MAG: glycosyltransferase family 4 protein, partial [Nitrososphaeraceae archaeon]
MSGHSKIAYELSCELIKYGFEVNIISNKLAPDIQHKHAILAKQYYELDKVILIELKRFDLQSLINEDVMRYVSDSDYFHFFTPSLSIIEKFNSIYPGKVLWHVTSDYLTIKDIFVSGISTYLEYLIKSPDKILNVYRKFAYNRISDKCKYVLCSTIYIYNRLCELGIKESKIIYIPYGVILKERAIKEDNIEKGDINYLYFGWLSPIRGLTDLLMAFDYVSSKNNRARLLIANPGGHFEEAKMLSLINNCGNRHAIIILPWQDNIYDIIKSSDVVVLPFRGSYGYSQPPLVVIEAMNASKPIISTNVGCMAEYITSEKTGILIEPKDIRALIIAMNSMNDKDKCFRMGEEAHKVIHGISWRN